MKSNTTQCEGNTYIVLTNWKVSNYIVDRLIKGWTVKYCSDTKSICSWRGSRYCVTKVSDILKRKTGVDCV